MSKMDLASYLLRIKCSHLTKIEKSLLELQLLVFICRELHEIFTHPYKDYIRLLFPFNYHKEIEMFNLNLTQEIIKDILSTNEYSLSGIAIHTHIPEEVLSDIFSGINKHPTFELVSKLIELHMIVRQDLYNEIIRKIISKFILQTKPEDELN
ncbi:MAG: hypothetical protein JO149_01640 [Gammaproteobacteria bacterium]|nr:hypothetical protein [Gammaproteobacteria bacterium]